MQAFTTSDGTRIAYRDEGRGRTIVLLHGLMANGAFFSQQTPLADAFRLLAIDLRGHGASEAAGALTIDRLARDVAELVEALGIEDAIGVGWSLGAAILWKVLSGSEGDRFAGAVVVDMTPRVANGGGWRLGLEPEHCAARTRAIAEDFGTFATGAGQAIFARRPGEPVHAKAGWAGEQFAAGDAAAIGAVWRSLTEEDFRPLLGRIGQPTLIVHGAHSHLYGPETAAHLAEGLPNARIHRFEQSGHSPHIEQPELFNRTIRDFAASLPPVRATEESELEGREP